MLCASWQEQLAPTIGYCADGTIEGKASDSARDRSGQELFAKITAESADVPVAEAVADARLPALRAKLPGLVGTTLETLVGRPELHHRAWRHLSVTEGTRDEFSQTPEGCMPLLTSSVRWQHQQIPCLSKSSYWAMLLVGSCQQKTKWQIFGRDLRAGLARSTSRRWRWEGETGKEKGELHPSCSGSLVDSEL